MGSLDLGRSGCGQRTEHAKKEHLTQNQPPQTLHVYGISIYLHFSLIHVPMFHNKSKKKIHAFSASFWDFLSAEFLDERVPNFHPFGKWNPIFTSTYCFKWVETQPPPSNRLIN